jgi:hypothetical protein
MSQSEYVKAMRVEHNRMRRAQDEEAQQDRDRMARELGFADFKQWMAYGLVAGWNRAGLTRDMGTDVAALKEMLGVTAKEFAPSPERLAADRRALGLEDDGEVEAP